MRILPILAAAAVAAFAVPAVASAAPAAPAKAGAGNQVHVSIGSRHRHRAHWRTVCTTKWRHHHRVRTCHRVRVWR